MSSSPAISLVKPLGRPLKACPYCDHVSPTDAKFCGACGAALHLLPCPNCGAVNDITKVSACYRCHQALEESTVQAAALPAPGAPADVAAEANHADDHAGASRQRPHTAAVIIVLIAFGAASYYAYRQRSSLANHEIAPPGNEAKGSVNAVPAPSPATTPPVAAPATPTKSAGPTVSPAAPVAAEAKKDVVIVPPVSTAAVPPAPAIAPATTTRRSRPPREAPSAAAAPPDAPATRSPGVGIQTEAPRIGPCTDAVAALGLCTRDTAPNPATPPAQKRQ